MKLVLDIEFDAPEQSKKMQKGRLAQKYRRLKMLEMQ